MTDHTEKLLTEIRDTLQENQRIAKDSADFAKAAILKQQKNARSLMILFTLFFVLVILNVFWH